MTILLFVLFEVSVLLALKYYKIRSAGCLYLVICYPIWILCSFLIYKDLLKFGEPFGIFMFLFTIIIIICLLGFAFIPFISFLTFLSTDHLKQKQIYLFLISSTSLLVLLSLLKVSGYIQ